MKYLALSITLIGIISLFLYMQFSLPLEITNSNNLIYLEDNQKVIVQGKIISKKLNENNIFLKLDNNITLNCYRPCKLKLNVGEKVSITSRYNEFYNSLDIIR